MSYVDPSSVDQVVTRIRQRLAELGISEREASRRAGFSPGYVSDVIHGRSREPAMPRLIRLARALECDPHWLIGSQVAAKSATEQRTFVDALPKSTRLIDLFSARSTSDEVWVNPSLEAIDKVPVIPPLINVPSAYAWSICSPYMEPRYYVGEVVYLHPGLTARPGDFVLIRLKSGLTGVVRMVAASADEVTLELLNHPDRTCVKARSEIDYIHRIVGSAG